ncbi:MAG: PadR family transcriptional regulator [Candidatus Binatus sp.]|nr:PadR family transcriptional regulator [Candidatus Binatus sp.]
MDRLLGTAKHLNGASRVKDALAAAKIRAMLAAERRPPRMDVKFPILGFLMESAATGYDLKRRFRNPPGFFYRVSDGSLYPALQRLARDQLVTMRTERQGRRARKVYAITAKGRQTFARILRQPAQPPFVFDESQVKIYFADREPELALEHMTRAYRDDSERAELLGRVAAHMRAAGAGTIRRSGVEIGRAVTEAKAKVLARLIAQLKREIQLARSGPPQVKRSRGANVNGALNRNGSSK